MARTKNTNRKKRKYTDIRKLKTSRNHTRQTERHDLLMAKMHARTTALIGKQVQIRVKDNIKPLVGTVQAVIPKGDDSYPVDARRKVGNYLRVRTSVGDRVVSRHRVKVIH